MTSVDQRKFQQIVEGLGYDGPVDSTLPKKAPKIYEDAMVLWMRWKCLNDLYYLGATVLGLGEVKDRRGKKIVDPNLHVWLCKVLSEPHDKMILIPRRHAKTFWVKVKIMQSILKDPGTVRIGLYSKTTDLVTAELKSIIQMFQTPALMALFPEEIPNPGKGYRNWERVTSEKLTIKRVGDTAPQENQLEVYGAGSVVTGKHFDEHYYDDILNEDDARSVEGNRKVIEWYGYIQSILEPGGSETVTGTPYHYSDLYAYIEQERIYGKHVYKRPAIVRGKPIYSYFSLKMLDRLKKRQGDYMFSCQYMVNPIPREDQLFPPPQPTYNSLPKEEYTWYITVDPAATTKAYSDETAFCVAAINRQGWVYVEDCFGVKKKGNEIAEILLNLNEKYSPVRIGIEFGLQEHLRHIITMVQKGRENATHKKIHLPLIPLTIRKVDKYQRINLTLGSFVRQGKIKFKYNLYRLFEQMDKINPNYSGHDDLVDSASMIFQLVEQFSFKSWESPLWDAPNGGLGFDFFSFNPPKSYTSYYDRSEVMK